MKKKHCVICDQWRHVTTRMKNHGGSPVQITASLCRGSPLGLKISYSRQSLSEVFEKLRVVNYSSWDPTRSFVFNGHREVMWPLLLLVRTFSLHQFTTTTDSKSGRKVRTFRERIKTQNSLRTDQKTYLSLVIITFVICVKLTCEFTIIVINGPLNYWFHFISRVSFFRILFSYLYFKIGFLTVSLISESLTSRLL